MKAGCGCSPLSFPIPFISPIPSFAGLTGESIFIIFAGIMVFDLLRAMLVGVIVALPVGPILVMVVQRTLCHSRKCGWTLGLGAATADTVYAAIGLLTVGLIRGFVQAHEAFFLLAGGVVLGLVGFGILTRKVSFSLPEDKRELSGWVCYWEGFLSALGNPAALALVLVLLAAFGLGAGQSKAPVWALIPMVWLGEALYWRLVTRLLARYLHIGERKLRLGSKIAGWAVCGFAVVLLVRGLWMIIG